MRSLTSTNDPRLWACTTIGGNINFRQAQGGDNYSRGRLKLTAASIPRGTLPWGREQGKSLPEIHAEQAGTSDAIGTSTSRANISLAVKWFLY